jgi:hypothetical protein
MLLAQVEIPKELPPPEGNMLYVYVGVGILLLAIVLFVLKSLFGGKKRAVDPDRSLRETLAEYPPAPASGSGRVLHVHGVEVRLRLVVVAPAGKQQDPISPDEVPALLDGVMRGLGAFVKSDRARVKVWPPQLSLTGFGPTFIRLVDSPDPEGKPSMWIRVAGPARSEGRPFLLGLALAAIEPSKLGKLMLEPADWVKALTIERSGN